MVAGMTEEIDLIGTSEAAQILGVNTTSVWRYVKIGDLEPAYVQEGGRRTILFRPADVIAFRDRRLERLGRSRSLREHGVKGIDRIAS